MGGGAEQAGTEGEKGGARKRLLARLLASEGSEFPPLCRLIVEFCPLSGGQLALYSNSSWWLRAVA